MAAQESEDFIEKPTEFRKPENKTITTENLPTNKMPLIFYLTFLQFYTNQN